MDVITGHILRCVSFDPCPEDRHEGSPNQEDLKLRSSGRKIIASDPYVKVSVPQAAVARTRVLKNSKNPKWNERFNIPLAHEVVQLEFEVKDDDIFGADLLGTVHIPAEKIAIGDEIYDWFDLKNSRKESQLRLKMKFTPCENNPIYRNGIAGDPEQRGVWDTYFPVRKGSQVTLYQDAHVRAESKTPEIQLDGGRFYEQGRCWEDICHAISSAHHMIYIVGWSIYHKVKLIREPTRSMPRGGDQTLGDLLKYKSEEGVRVLLLVWDDKTSHSTLFGNTMMIKHHDLKYYKTLEINNTKHTSTDHQRECFIFNNNYLFSSKFHQNSFPSTTFSSSRSSLTLLFIVELGSNRFSLSIFFFRLALQITKRLLRTITITTTKSLALSDFYIIQSELLLHFLLSGHRHSFPRRRHRSRDPRIHQTGLFILGHCCQNHKFTSPFAGLFLPPLPVEDLEKGWGRGELLQLMIIQPTGTEYGIQMLLIYQTYATSWNQNLGHELMQVVDLDLHIGVMDTHDEETKKFFKHSSVKCVLSPRYGSGKLGLFKQKVVGGAFTHHQKCVLVDTQAYGNNRKITAFIGGLDLCDGRYDTPEHRLFHDLDTIFKDDVHQPTFPVSICIISSTMSYSTQIMHIFESLYFAGTKAPRQPWHDLHCKIDGPAAYDVLLNFEQRWRKATRFREFAFVAKRIAHWEDDSLLKIDRISWILSPTNQNQVKEAHTVVPADDPLVYVSSEDDPDNWHVQIFRSIDSGSLKGFPKTVDVAEEQHLVTAKNMVIEKSIQTAYIQAIRSAQHFIYIENQYFIGSSYAWSYENAGADNLIPMELAQKIASKIRNNERFAVYVVIPMWPEGVPTSATVQEILYWQSQTMEMMYGVVAQAIKSMQLNAHPQDYLNFYCLGKREHVPFNNNQSFADEKVSESQKFQRFMIYVHAKGMIVDDEYVIVGSANINQRSMAGSKDTEIAMGSYQPHHTWAAKKRHPHGQVYGYRMSLWAEHLGVLEKCYKDPETLECVKNVNKLAEENWKRYINSDYTTLQGHLLRYPLQVDDDGNVKPLPKYENFPDVGGKILGAHSPTLPDILTT
ncbi:hypothetical protein M8C21_027057 [Ambrosia artemisiifolia]|uniref:phospholipase D n=1 Tax=Ambrosia artemisiifolia TaxID=4212 RepID=A0AAD5BWS6_AMBAR|nr:hypothetical protein M8C21_027057 [Ambrosia artemisiifolia]